MHRENGYLSQEGLYPTNYIHRGVRHVQRAALWTAKHEFRDCRVVVARQPVSDCVFSFCDKEGVPEAKLVCSSSFFFFTSHLLEILFSLFSIPLAKLELKVEAKYVCVTAWK
jgi:hypothetical protein